MTKNVSVAGYVEAFCHVQSGKWASYLVALFRNRCTSIAPFIAPLSNVSAGTAHSLGYRRFSWRAGAPLPRAFLQALPIRSANADAHVALARPFPVRFYRHCPFARLSPMLMARWRAIKIEKPAFSRSSKLGSEKAGFSIFAVLVETRKVKEPTPELLCLQNQFFKCAIRGSNPGHPD